MLSATYRDLNTASNLETSKEKQAAQIVIAQISLLFTTLNNDNFESVEREIRHILDRSSVDIYIKVWERLLTLSSRDILQAGKFFTSRKFTTQTTIRICEGFTEEKHRPY